MIELLCRAIDESDASQPVLIDSFSGKPEHAQAFLLCTDVLRSCLPAHVMCAQCVAQANHAVHHTTETHAGF